MKKVIMEIEEVCGDGYIIRASLKDVAGSEKTYIHEKTYGLCSKLETIWDAITKEKPVEEIKSNIPL